jgi:hypothetical protein
MNRVWSVDSEYGYRGEELPANFVPVVFCAVELYGGTRRHFWGRDPRLVDFIRRHIKDEFVAHNLIAEAKYLLQLGISPPAHWFDTMLAYRYVTNAEYVKPFGLLKAVEGRGLSPRATEDEKKGLQTWVGELRFDPASPDDRRRIEGYCYDDCEQGADLYHSLAGCVPPTWMAHVVEFCLATARQELRGVPVDAEGLARLRDRKDEVIAGVVARSNARCPVFRDGALDEDALLRQCALWGIGWPEVPSPRTGLRYRPFDDDSFRVMAERHPALALVRETVKTIKHLSSRDLAVDYSRGLHFYGNIPCAQKTSRTSYKRCLDAGPKWLRFFKVPSAPDHVLVAVDFEAEEILLGAWLAGDKAMTAGYMAGDAHMDFAIRSGAAPEGATKDDPRYSAVRKLYKATNLAINYGQGARGLADRTGMHVHDARKLLAQHRRAYPAFWQFMEGYIDTAFRRGRCVTRGGWPRAVGRRDNPRSVMNHPIQGSGADLMRLAVVYLTRNGLPLLAVLHDGFLFECRRDELAEVRRSIDDALGRAVGQLLPGAPMRWSVDVFPGRYYDAGGESVWRFVSRSLGLENKGCRNSHDPQMSGIAKVSDALSAVRSGG